ncbi:MAG: NADH:flavin oxidoreductase [Beduini sp.]|uniref:NADH:flavin oxidoreductase n=1 Tax=Beduini sp. TaxID=1922300 RepID=UPI0011C8A68F
MSRLNTSVRIKSLILKNRLVMPPMATSKADHGEINQAHLDYYKEKSLGGYLGLIITEHSYISDEGKASLHQVSLSKEEDVEGYRKLVRVIHENDTPVFAQINHAGSRTISETKLSASAVHHPRDKKDDPLPKEMSESDIEKVIKDFVNAAILAKKSGFDGVEIHSAHGYLLNQFYSPITNKRTDQYGGNLISRIRLHLEIIAAVRRAVGDDYPIALRLGACDYLEGGSDISDALEACIAFEKAGVDLLDISGGLNGYIRPNRNEEGYFGDVTSLIKENVSIPVLLTGGVKTASGAESLLEENSADLIGVGRALFQDSLWAKHCIESLI